MAVQQEIRSQLAKLLATEDIVVEHKQVETAEFNVRSRVLILPLWEKASNDVYDMLVGHEVGHALFTPDQDPPENIPHQFMNVVEDARIEKLMKRKYMGIAKYFYKGYNELHEQDFFELDGEDISDFNLADRANLYFKIGSFLDLSFSTPEKEIIDLISNAETFTETITAAEALYNFCKQEEKQKEFLENTEQAKVDFENDSDDSGDSSTSVPTDLDPTVPDTDASAPLEDWSDSTPSDDRVDDSASTVGSEPEPEVRTEDALRTRLKDLVDADGQPNEYVEIPKVDLDTIIVSNEDVHKEIDNHWKYEEEMWSQRGLGFKPNYEEVDAEYVKFKRDAQKEVNYLVKEFECKKAASAYARSATSRTGVLDTTKLPTYRFNEDLFKRITVLPDGKNHGLVFVLDWSGSMQYVLQDTLKQLYNLIWFCKKVNIPFDVYAFTIEWNGRYGYDNGEERKLSYTEKEGLLVVEDQFNLMNLFNSKVNIKNLDRQMLDIFRIAKCFRTATTHTYPQRLSLSGTPLNESLIALHQILPKFQEENKVEKVQCIILTDGEAHQLPRHYKVKRHWEDEPYLGRRSVHPHTTFLRDRKLGKIYKFGYSYSNFTDVLLQNLKDRFPSMNFIGIRILLKREAGQFIRTHCKEFTDEYNSVMSDWRKLRSFSIKTSGYDAYFGMCSSALSEDSEFDVDDDATKGQIKRAFVKSLKTKKLNKKVLGEFISLVA